MASESFAQRLDRLPISRFHWRLVIISGFGWMFDAMDILVLGSVIAAVAAAWQLDAQTRGLIISVNLAGMFVGAALAGTLADRFGRKTMFQVTLLAYSLLTGLSALAWNAVSLGVFRFLSGLGLGGELPVASTLVSEFAPARYRGFLIVILESFWAYGAVLAALIGFLFIPAFGWQAAFLVGALPALYVFYLRRHLPESPRFLAEHGRIKEAEEIVEFVEKESGVERPAAEQTHPAPIAEPSQPARFGELWQPGLLRRTVTLWVIWFAMVFSYYGIFTWLPSLLTAKGFGLQQAFLLNLIISIAQIPGYFSAALLVERWGRKPTLLAYIIGTAVGAWFFGQQTLGAEPIVTAVIFWGSVISFFNLGAWGVVYSYTPELYPTRIRGTGAGWAAAFGRIGGIVGPYAVGALLTAFAGNQAIPFGVFTGVMLVGGLVVFVLGEETKGRSLEQISA